MVTREETREVVTMEETREVVTREVVTMEEMREVVTMEVVKVAVRRNCDKCNRPDHHSFRYYFQSSSMVRLPICNNMEGGIQPQRRSRHFGTEMRR